MVALLLLSEKVFAEGANDRLFIVRDHISYEFVQIPHLEVRDVEPANVVRIRLVYQIHKHAMLLWVAEKLSDE